MYKSGGGSPTPPYHHGIPPPPVGCGSVSTVVLLLYPHLVVLWSVVAVAAAWSPVLDVPKYILLHYMFVFIIFVNASWFSIISLMVSLVSV